MSATKERWKTTRAVQQLFQESWFRLYIVCWLVSYISLMVFKVQWDFLYAQRALLDYTLGVYYAGAAIFCAVLALVMALILTGVLLGLYYCLLDLCVPRPTKHSQ